MSLPSLRLPQAEETSFATNIKEGLPKQSNSPDSWRLCRTLEIRPLSNQKAHREVGLLIYKNQKGRVNNSAYPLPIVLIFAGSRPRLGQGAAGVDFPVDDNRRHKTSWSIGRPLLKESGLILSAEFMAQRRWPKLEQDTGF